MSLCYFFYLSFFYKFYFIFFSIYFIINDYSLILEISFMNINSSSFVMTILFDWMSLIFMSFVLFISCIVINYSEFYMEGDLNLKRFIYLVLMFVFSMILLIISPNLISILLGWDGLGLVSYCLVIYYQNIKSYNAGMLTVLSNRVGDVALLISIAWMLNYGSWNYIFYLDWFKLDFSMVLISFMIVLAAMTKSAQIPFSSWLPAAMAAPTPVSSLVHSSTLVTAGVYLLIRFNLLFDSFLLYILLFFSILTMFMSGLGANFEFDLKKIIALSTLSQLGLMMSILCLGGYLLSFFHLLSHALFKALLFMCAGCFIHMVNNCQDIRYMGGLILHMPLTCLIFNLCNFSLCGFPFLAGFYSKDLILEFMSMSYFNLFIYLMFYLSTGLTVSYSFRLSYYVIFGNFNYFSIYLLSDINYNMMKGMLILGFTVIFGGSMLMWIIFPSPYFICLPLYFKIMALLVTIFGIWIGYLVSFLSFSYESVYLKNLFSSSFLGSMWNLPIISTFGVSFLPLYLSNLVYKNIDQGWSEYYGSQNIYINFGIISRAFQYLFSNNIKFYLILLVVWTLFVFIYLF
uniref:NADH-ubiquinone oxidoreductase chain 5 n=1 Tax=Eurypogon sp. EUR01 TaxID=1205553 RepID=A0A0S2MR17_9COLE|nr:NADH deshydrogenase subunit 5 [Eurypogon sp. EUR01]